MQFNLLKPPEGCLLDVDRIAGRSALDKSVQVNQVFEQKRHLVSRISFAYKELEKRKRKQWYLSVFSVQCQIFRRTNDSATPWRPKLFFVLQKTWACFAKKHAFSELLSKMAYNSRVIPWWPIAWPIASLSCAWTSLLFSSVWLCMLCSPWNSTVALRSSSLYSVTVTVTGQCSNLQ